MTENISNILETWLKNNLICFGYRRDGDIFTIRETASGKEIRLDAKKILAHEIKQHPPTRTSYLILMREDGVQIILCYAGLAFAPDTTATGPLPDAPPVSSLRDYFTLQQNLQSLIAEKRAPEALLVFNILIAILDGARRIGLNIGPEEEELSQALTAFEGQFKSQ